MSVTIGRQRFTNRFVLDVRMPGTVRTEVPGNAYRFRIARSVPGETSSRLTTSIEVLTSRIQP